jgi:hypothetical protein
MRTAPTLTVLLAACLGLAACGDGKAHGTGGGKGTGGGRGSPVGTWVIDVDKSLEAALATTKEELAQRRLSLARLPEVERTRAEAGLPQTEDEVHAFVQKRVGALRMRVELRADGGVSSEVSVAEKPETLVGTWRKEGKRILIVPVTRNGEPARDDHEVILELRDRRLVMIDEAGTEKAWLKRE